jgi:hypothetical protein
VQSQERILGSHKHKCLECPNTQVPGIYQHKCLAYANIKEPAAEFKLREDLDTCACFSRKSASSSKVASVCTRAVHLRPPSSNIADPVARFARARHLEGDPTLSSELVLGLTERPKRGTRTLSVTHDARPELRKDALASGHGALVPMDSVLGTVGGGCETERSTSAKTGKCKSPIVKGGGEDARNMPPPPGSRCPPPIFTS